MHHNGRINYKGQETHADGSHAVSKRAHEASLAILEVAADGTESDNEDALENALEEMLEAEMEGQEGDSDDDSDLDNEDDETHGRNDLIECIYNTPADLDVAGPKRKNDSSSSVTAIKKNRTSASVPDNFSQLYSIVLSDQKETDSKFPKFAGIRNKVKKFELNEGDMLYIPAGWYHEVLSCGINSTRANQNAHSKTHMAFNYWFHPPDNLDDFDKPYTSSFWGDVTENAMKKVIETKNKK